LDILLTHGYFLGADPLERAVMKPYPPLGLLYLSSYLKARGFVVEILDTTPLDVDTALRAIETRRPKLVGMYVTLMTRANALKLVAKCKEVGAIVILGGPEPINYAEEYIARGADIIVAGEGEKTLEELIPHLRRCGLTALDGIAGIRFRGQDGSVVATPSRGQITDLNQQPFPDRGAIDLEWYLRTWKTHHGVRSISLITARGCPYTCNWCSHSVYGRSHRRRSPENVAAEIEQVRDRYAPDQLWYADDVFTIHPKWLERFAGELKRRGLAYPFETITREDRLDDKIIAILADMRCYRLWIGAESGSQRVLDAMDRRTNAARLRQMIKSLRQKGIRAGTFIMLGYDGETWEDLNATAGHLREAVPDDVLTTVSYPIKGTPYYQNVADRIVATRKWEESSDRELTVTGRGSPRFYRLAQRWLHAETDLARMRGVAHRNLKRYAAAKVVSTVSRVGMYIRRHEVSRA
jgi:radical SAM superfamily enzyme YgiQ (UPF0313 family)